MDSITFTVPDPPRGKGRPRFSPRGAVHTDSKTARYERLVRDYARIAMLNHEMLERAVRVDLYVTFEVAKSWSKKKKLALLHGYHTQTPDLDNVIKAVTDAMNGVVYKDDCQIAELRSRKLWGEVAKVEVVITELDPWQAYMATRR